MAGNEQRKRFEAVGAAIAQGGEARRQHAAPPEPFAAASRRAPQQTARMRSEAVIFSAADQWALSPS